MDSSTAAAPKVVKAKKPRATKKVASHPPVATMVVNAIKELKDRKGSSLASIKKHVAANNKVDMNRISPFIRKALKNGVAKGSLVQTKGTGASGSFKLSKAEPKPKKVKTPKKKAAKKPAAKKAAKSTPKKKVAKKPAKAKKSPAKAKKSPAKAKKPAAKKAAAKKTPTKRVQKPKVKKSPAKKAGAKKPKAKKAAK